MMVRMTNIEPLYLPGGGIVFGSSRVHRQVPCWFTEAAILHSCGADGSNIHPFPPIKSSTRNTPCMLPGRRILYMRWEYVDRHEGAYHHLWTVNTGWHQRYGLPTLGVPVLLYTDHRAS